MQRLQLLSFFFCWVVLARGAAAAVEGPLELLARIPADISTVASANSDVSASTSASPASTNPPPTSTSIQLSASPSGSMSGSAESSQAAPTSGSVQGSSTSGSAQPSTTAAPSINPVLPPGGISMVSPASSSSTLYKISADPITFIWNYTSLQVNPTAIDVLVSCTANLATYTLASNVSFDSTGTATWDTSKETGLVSDHYTLVVYDADSAVTAIPKAGYLEKSQYLFGMYQPQAYANLTKFVCVTCSAAASSLHDSPLMTVLSIGALTSLALFWL